MNGWWLTAFVDEKVRQFAIWNRETFSLTKGENRKRVPVGFKKMKETAHGNRVSFTLRTCSLTTE